MKGQNTETKRPNINKTFYKSRNNSMKDIKPYDNFPNSHFEDPFNDKPGLKLSSECGLGVRRLLSTTSSQEQISTIISK